MIVTMACGAHIILVINVFILCTGAWITVKEERSGGTPCSIEEVCFSNYRLEVLHRSNASVSSLWLSV
jgi:hypothetical protein